MQLTGRMLIQHPGGPEFDVQYQKQKQSIINEETTEVNSRHLMKGTVFAQDIPRPSSQH